MNKIKRGIKMRVTPEQSRNIQEICFDNGVYWAIGKDSEQYIDKPYLYINKYGVLSYSDELGNLLFNKDDKEEVSAELFIRTNGTCIESEVPSEPQPKTLSEYLKENGAYESFIENCVEDALENLSEYEDFSEYDYKIKKVKINNVFIWHNTKQGSEYWTSLYHNQPENLIYDMDKVVFTEVDKRITGQKPTTEFISTEEFEQMLQQKTPTQSEQAELVRKKYMVFVEGKSRPKKVHDSYSSAEQEAKRLSAKEIGLKVFVVEVVKEFKSKVIVEELK